MIGSLERLRYRPGDCFPSPRRVSTYAGIGRTYTLLSWEVLADRFDVVEVVDHERPVEDLQASSFRLYIRSSPSSSYASRVPRARSGRSSDHRPNPARRSKSVENSRSRISLSLSPSRRRRSISRFTVSLTWICSLAASIVRLRTYLFYLSEPRSSRSMTTCSAFSPLCRTATIVLTNKSHHSGGWRWLIPKLVVHPPLVNCGRVEHLR